MSELTCVECGQTFTLPRKTREQYPNWTPKKCRACHQGRGNGRPSKPVEENLPVAQVLQTYTDGPSDGVFTDGSATPNPGPGGWGAVYVRDGEIVDRAYGHDPDTTNNRMELTALIEGIRLVPRGTPATVYTDSRLVVDTLTKWAPGWKKRGWTRKTGEVSNVDLVKEAYELTSARPEIELAWIRAHSGARWNEYADALSTAYRRDEL
jgi:ribonuclease HI